LNHAQRRDRGSDDSKKIRRPHLHFEQSELTHVLFTSFGFIRLAPLHSSTGNSRRRLLLQRHTPAATASVSLAIQNHYPRTIRITIHTEGPCWRAARVGCGEGNGRQRTSAFAQGPCVLTLPPPLPPPPHLFHPVFLLLPPPFLCHVTSCAKMCSCHVTSCAGCVRLGAAQGKDA
jgi:hypothetical protein